MEQIEILPLIGALISFIGPLGYSIWKETRYVQRAAGAVYGLSSISFGLLYYHILGYSDVGLSALAVFVPAGILFLILSKYINIWGNGESLIFSYKTLGGFQFGFLYSAYLIPILGNLPQAVEEPILNILVFGGGVTILLHSTIAPVRYVKNQH